MTALRERFRDALAPGAGMQAFDRRVWEIRGKRLRAAALHPRWDELRRSAAAIEAYAIDHLDEYLERFAERATAAGAVVHFASDAATANEIVRSLCTVAGARLAVKSKSMTTEECGLNEHLARHGIEVVDTDLGERIVQLLGEPPSHIVAPAIHLSTGEIGELFHRVLGAPVGERDPARLTAVARRHLRPIFLAARVGITGVNFAVAETGSIVVVENEGNSLLSTSIPDVHIAVMGIDKIVPEVADLGVMLDLLARSATGQRITTYTTHYTGPQRRAPEEEGPERQLHIVVLDNGRTKLLRDEVAYRSLSCIRCGACLNVCPVYRRVGGHAYGWIYPGPIGSVIAPLMVPENGSELPFASSLCGACTEACPVGIDLHEQLIARRDELFASGRARSPLPRFAAAFLTRPRLARWVLGLLRRCGLEILPSKSWQAPREGRPSRLLPRPAPVSFVEWWRGRRERRR